MCLIHYRSTESEPEVIIAARPVSIRPLSSQSQPKQPVAISTLPRTSNTSHNSIRPLSIHSRNLPRSDGQRRHSQVVVIEQRSPRSSDVLMVPQPQPNLSRHGQRGSASSLRVVEAPMIMQRTRRSGSFVDPRDSNTSWRSTREKVVIVDERGVRREYYR